MKKHKKQVNVIIGNHYDLINEPIIEYLNGFLNEKYDFRFKIITSQKEILEFIEQQSFDLCILFIFNIIGQLDFIEFISEIKSSCEIPILLMSSFSENDEVAKEIRIAADFYLQTPFKLNILKETVEECLQKDKSF